MEARESRPWLPITVAGAVIVVGLLATLSYTDARAKERNQYELRPVTRAPILRSAKLGGSIEPSEKIVLTARVGSSRSVGSFRDGGGGRGGGGGGSGGGRGDSLALARFEQASDSRPRIIWLIDEGSSVNVGDLLVQLETSQLEDSQHELNLEVLNFQASVAQAETALTVTKIEAEALISAAELALQFAEADLRKYKEGDYILAKALAESDILLAEADYQQSAYTYEWSSQLFDKGFVTRTEVDRDRIAVERDRARRQRAEGDFNLLTRYEYDRSILELEESVKRADLALKLTKHQAQSNIVAAEVALAAAKLGLENQRRRLEDIDEEFANAAIRAPIEGVAIYASSSGGGGRRGFVDPSRMVQIGNEVYRGMELIHLSAVNKVVAQTQIHESLRSQVYIGQPVRVRADVMPGRIFGGHIKKIDLIPDGRVRAQNADLTVYNATIEIDGDTQGLKPGVNCQIEVLLDYQPDAVLVPIEAIVWTPDPQTRKLNSMVYVPGAAGPVAKPIEIGLYNALHVQVVSGLQPGDQVLLARSALNRPLQ